MVKTFFKNLAEKENGKFYFQDENVATFGGVRNPNVIFKVVFTYKNNQFSIINRTGTAYVGNITCQFHKELQPIEFELSSISHLKNLLLRKKSRFKIKSKSKNLIYFIEQNGSLQKLVKIAGKENFSPLMICNLDDGKIETKYHLEFDDWTGVVEPIIELYKSIIDEFEKRELNTSHNSYRYRLQ